MKELRTAFIHYSAPPVVGGVEAVINAHARAFLDAGYPVKLIAGCAEQSALPDGVELDLIPLLDTQNQRIQRASHALESGIVPRNFQLLGQQIAAALRPALQGMEVVIVHNVFTKHFNLPLTAALFMLLEEGSLRNCLAWCHDITWASPNSGKKMFPGYPWDLLRTYSPKLQYVTVSEQRQQELAGLLQRPVGEIKIVYNGVDPCVWFGLTPEGWNLVRQMDLLSGDLILLMPVRMTQAKNIELAARVVAALKTGGCHKPRLVITGPPDPHDAQSLAYFRQLLDLRNALGLKEELRFVFEEMHPSQQNDFLSQQVVADLLRVSDLVFLPSHREGFGLPVLEAGLIGLPVVASEHVPAARELAGKYVYLFDTNQSPEAIAKLILSEAVNNRAYKFRREVRQNFTWERIFQLQIEPLLQGDAV